MTVSKVPRTLILFVILALAAAVVVAGCGGGGGTTTTEQGPSPGSNTPETTEEPEVEEEPAEESEPAEEEAPAGEAEEAEEENEETANQETGGEASLVAEGKTVFATNCGSCHTLKAAGTSGKIGPNLDELEPDLATVEHQVVNGGGAMPAFGKEGLLNAKEVKAVATYVSSVAGTG